MGVFGGFSQVEGFEAGVALAVVEGELGKGGVRFGGAARAAEAELVGAVVAVGEAGGAVELKLLRLRPVVGGSEVADLLGGGRC